MKGKRFVLALIITFAATAVLEITYDVPSEEDSKMEQSTVQPCKLDPDGLDFVPNIYYCARNESCCAENNQANCCATDISTKSITDQIILWGVVLGALFVISILAAYYFKDRYCCIDDTEDEEATCSCYKREHTRDAMNRMYPKFKSVAFPDEESSQVEDPIFGRQGSSDEIPREATLHSIPKKSFNLSQINEPVPRGQPPSIKVIPATPRQKK